MMVKFQTWLHWIISRPVALINLIGILVIIFGIFGYVVFQTTRSIDVLTNWNISLSSPKESRDIDGKSVAVYHPGDSLVFISTSNKSADAEGTSVRMIVCDATDTQKAREIQLDQIPATRPIGKNANRENAVVIPDVSQFAGLPRWCRLVIDITYKDVNGTGRTQQEHAETDKFLVEEAKLDTAGLLDKIENLEKQITELKSQLPSNGGEASSVSAPASPQPAPAASGSQTTTPPQSIISEPAQSTPTDDGFQLHDVPLLGGLFKAIGL